MNLSYEPDPQIAGGVVVRLSGNLDIIGATKLWDDVSIRAGEETRFFIFDFTYQFLKDVFQGDDTDRFPILKYGGQ